MNNGFYGFPNILGLLRGTNLKVLGKAGATAGAGLAGGTTSGAPVSGSFDVGEAVIGADGTLFICTATGSPGTWVQLGTLVDPLTTRGDLLVRGASSTTRLALGTTNYVLTSNGTDVAWAIAPASAGGALTQIATTTVGAGGVSAVDFSSIPGTYSSLWLHVCGASDQATTVESVNIQFNSDSGANYDFQGAYGAGASGTASQESTVARTSLPLVGMPGTTAPANAAGLVFVVIPQYAATTFRKGFTAHSSRESGTTAGTIVTEVIGGFWRNAAAITALHMFPDAGKFIQGSSFVLYGAS